jgi:Rps23 Pro-64 3,4-dihydroxylase Tpa1-like proline 4-hydroxylase
MNMANASISVFNINPKLKTDDLYTIYHDNQRVHVGNFMMPADADRLYRHLVADFPWRTLLVANERQLGTTPQTTLTSDEHREAVEVACDGARSGFASLFDADRVLSQEISDDSQSTSEISLVTNFLNSMLFLDVVRSTTGIPELTHVDVQVTRFRPGHFVTFHDATYSADKTGKRRAGFELNLTPEWRPEWGGMLEFRGQEAHDIHAFMPCFNSLDLFAFPQGRWISAVSPFANGPRYAISGYIYAS